MVLVIGFAVTMRYLVTDDGQVTIAANYRMSPSAVGRIISETCQAIWDTLIDKVFLQSPKSEKDCKRIAFEFEKKWNFPNSIEAIDGKNIVMEARPRSGSSLFNYKKTHSIVLMAIYSAMYTFLQEIFFNVYIRISIVETKNSVDFIIIMLVFPERVL